MQSVVRLPSEIFHLYSSCFRCPSFQYQGDQQLSTEVVVTSTCKFNRTSGYAEWSPASPDNILDGHNTLIESAGKNPRPSCGCENLVLSGQVEDEAVKVFSCNGLVVVNEDGDTVFKDDVECILLCAGLHLWDLSCMMGRWIPLGISSAKDISCFDPTTPTGDPSDPTASTDADNVVTLSTYWPTAKA